MSNMYTIYRNEGFSDLNIHHVGGYWIWIQFPSSSACSKFQENESLIKLYLVKRAPSSNFTVDELEINNELFEATVQEIGSWCIKITNDYIDLSSNDNIKDVDTSSASIDDHSVDDLEYIQTNLNNIAQETYLGFYYIYWFMKVEYEKQEVILFVHRVILSITVVNMDVRVLVGHARNVCNCWCICKDLCYYLNSEEQYGQGKMVNTVHAQVRLILFEVGFHSLVVGDEKQPVEAENLVDAGHNEDQEVFEVETFTHWLEAHIDWVGDVIDYCCGERLEYEEQLKDIVSPTRHFSNGLVVLPNNDEEWWKMFSAEISAQFKVDVASMSIALVEMMLIQSDVEPVEEPQTKKFKVMMDISSPIPLNSMRPTTINNIPFYHFTA
ncbi:hypothetical protein Tco_0138870 [Tanacetum coccineum]